MLNIWLVSSSLRMSEVTALVPWLRSTCEGVEAAASATYYNSSRVHGLTLCFADLGMCFAAAVASNPVRSSFVFKTGAPHKVKKSRSLIKNCCHSNVGTALTWYSCFPSVCLSACSSHPKGTFAPNVHDQTHPRTPNDRPNAKPLSRQDGSVRPTCLSLLSSVDLGSLGPEADIFSVLLAS